jgi:hypothetical protein
MMCGAATKTRLGNDRRRSIFYPGLYPANIDRAYWPAAAAVLSSPIR